MKKTMLMAGLFAVMMLGAVVVKAGDKFEASTPQVQISGEVEDLVVIPGIFRIALSKSVTVNGVPVSPYASIVAEIFGMKFAQFNGSKDGHLLYASVYQQGEIFFADYIPGESGKSYGVQPSGKTWDQIDAGCMQNRK